MEKILKIKDYEATDGYNHVAGFEVVTNKQSIKLYIDNDKSCCERSIIMKDYRQLLSILQEQNKQFRKQIHLNLDYFMVKNNVYYTDLNELDMLLGFPI